jgi:hypothetical protein
VSAHLCGSQPAQEPQAPDPDKSEWDIGNHIANMRDAQPAPLIGESMVALRLSDARRQGRRDDDQHRHGQQEPDAGLVSNHQVIPIKCDRFKTTESRKDSGKFLLPHGIILLFWWLSHLHGG